MTNCLIGHLSRKMCIRDSPQQDVIACRRISQRTQNIEDAANPDFFSGHGGELHGTVKDVYKRQTIFFLPVIAKTRYAVRAFSLSILHGLKGRVNPLNSTKK